MEKVSIGLMLGEFILIWIVLFIVILGITKSIKKFTEGKITKSEMFSNIIKFLTLISVPIIIPTIIFIILLYFGVVNFG